MSSGASGVKPTKDDFQKQLQLLMADLSSLLINDAEGATKVITIDVVNAKSEIDAVNVGRSIARNNLLKCAMFGEDPNWGRILAAVGTADAFLDSNAIDVYLNDSQICGNGAALLSLEKVSLKNRSIHIKVDLKVGNDKATIYTNDLSTQYVHENSAYST
jgi:glutamate N-acetyltransferase/amino-acid N-acetyltransferase